VLVGTAAPEEAVTAVVPAQIKLTFNEPVLAVGTILIVTGPAGQAHTGARHLGRQHRHRTPAAGLAGGHPVSGQFSFTSTSASPCSRPRQNLNQLSPAGTSSTTGTASSAVRAGTHLPGWWVAAGRTVALLHM